ncbi:MAG: hypothetical protein OSA81_11550 [Longimicrobiales bacterium]|nr:hypothetical protein [Longimicrobiales bacterium]
MDDRTLLAFGCGVMFLFLAGSYVLARASFSATETDQQAVGPERSGG